MILRCGHRVTTKFRRSQIVTPVAAVNMALMEVTAPCIVTKVLSCMQATFFTYKRVDISLTGILSNFTWD